MSVRTHKTADWTSVIQTPLGEGDNQKFKAIYNSDGTYSLVPMHAIKSFVVRNGTRVKISESAAVNNTKFYISCTNGKYILTSKNSASVGTAIGVIDNAQNQYIDEFTYDPNNPNLQWSFEETSASWQPENGKVYYIKNYSSGLYFDVKDGLSTSGTIVLQYVKKSTDNQKWRAVLNSDNTYSFIPLNAQNTYLEDVSSSIQITTGQNTDNKKFLISFYKTNMYKIVPYTGTQTNSALTVPNNNKSTPISETTYTYTSNTNYWSFEAA
jgi:hypothetical protein